MAAIDLERGLEHGGRGWGNERPELMDNFDSEMQEWEDQLQDIQRKIEEVIRLLTEKLYKKCSERHSHYITFTLASCCLFFSMYRHSTVLRTDVKI